MYKKLIKNFEKKFLEFYKKKINEFRLLQIFCEVDSTWVKNYWRIIFRDF